MNPNKAKKQLDDILNNLNPQDFIDNDPISIPKRFSTKQDIEISAFFAATLAWGQRNTIINNTNKLMHWMGEEPHKFILEHSDSDLKAFEKFVHRTFNSTDCLYFIEVLKQFYLKRNSLEDYFVGESMKEKISYFHQAFFDPMTVGFEFPPMRTKKHIANPAKNSSAKRLNMYLRWMVRNDGLDFGIWKSIKPSELRCPLDVHVQRSAFHFGLLTRKQQDWKAVDELSNNLLKLDAIDPIKYDLALFKWSESKMA
ncbi:MAG: TIGR02757 family protein [Bacteroidetes bacterium]|nr:MAG: TIGR02757 family protein [Bacteroidota bacterium]